MKNLNKMETLNALTIKWSIVIVDGYITKKIQEEIGRNKIIGGASITGNVISGYSANDEYVEKINKEYVKILTRNGKTGRIFTITDKQFGLSTINYDGCAKNTEVSENNLFIVSVDGASVRSYPVTKLQVKNQIKF
jgi:hypothetical protein